MPPPIGAISGASIPGPGAGAVASCTKVAGGTAEVRILRVWLGAVAPPVLTCLSSRAASADVQQTAMQRKAKCPSRAILCQLADVKGTISAPAVKPCISDESVREIHNLGRGLLSLELQKQPEVLRSEMRSSSDSQGPAVMAALRFANVLRHV